MKRYLGFPEVVDAQPLNGPAQSIVTHRLGSDDKTNPVFSAADFEALFKAHTQHPAMSLFTLARIWQVQ